MPMRSAQRDGHPASFPGLRARNLALGGRVLLLARYCGEQSSVSVCAQGDPGRGDARGRGGGQPAPHDAALPRRHPAGGNRASGVARSLKMYVGTLRHDQKCMVDGPLGATISTTTAPQELAAMAWEAATTFPGLQRKHHICSQL